MRDTENGFTVIEVVVAAAIGFFVLWAMVAAAGRFSAVGERLHDRFTAQADAQRLEERLTAESASAWAVFVPTADVLNIDNADGHEVDFFTEDGAHRPFAWAYRFDASARTLTRYSYAPGASPVATDVYRSLRSFQARPQSIATLGDPLFAGASSPSVVYPFAAMPSAIGGNGLVEVTIGGPGIDTQLTLASATAPTTFTIVLDYTPAPNGTPTPGPLPTLTPRPSS